LIERGSLIRGSNMSDENQHWLAKFHLRYFVGSDRRLYCMNVQTDEVSRLPPKYAASGGGYNDFVIDGQVVSFEDQLEKIETAAAPIIKRIAKSHSLAGLSPRQRTRVADYMAAQCFRTDAFYKGLNFGSEREKFGPVFAQLWRSAFLVSKEIQRRRWALMIIDTRPPGICIAWCARTRYADCRAAFGNCKRLNWSSTGCTRLFKPLRGERR
jgi:hypothetical protein